MIKPLCHSREKRSSVESLIVRVRYIADSTHKNHLNKLVLPSKNHDCLDDSVDEFIRSGDDRRKAYLQRREGLKGKRTKFLWREFMFSSEEGTVEKVDGTGRKPRINDEERGEVERAFLAGPLGRGPCRHGWHIDMKTGRCDWHCLCGEHDIEGRIWVNDGFGKGKKCLKLELERIEEVLLARLNKKRPPERQLKTARQRHREKRKKAGKLTCAEKLAAGKWDGTPEKLTEAAEQAGYVVHTQTKKSITVQSLDCKKRPKIIRYGIATLTRNWAMAKAKSLPKKPPKPDDPDVTGPEM
jgi:hypothetical protein